MATTYGSFPGVQVTTSGGGITGVAIGDEENLVIFGAANYQNDGTFDGSDDPLVSNVTGSTNTAEQINGRQEADDTFGSGSELADAMKEALTNEANIDFLYGVAPVRKDVSAETQSTQTGTLTNFPIWEDEIDTFADITNLSVDDTGAGTVDNVEYSYDGAPTAPSTAETVAVNPHTGEYAADAAPDGDYEFSYKYLDWNSAFTASSVQNAVAEDETGLYVALTESDSVASDLESEVSTRRNNFQLINGLTGAEPNDNESVDTDGDGNEDRKDARYDTASYDTANQTIDADYFFKFAPVREEDAAKTVMGGVGGLFAGNPISDPIYNDEVLGYDSLEQTLTKTDADNLRDENIIPVRQNGSIRVKANTSTSTSTDWTRDFWRRRIVDRVILIGKTVGDTTIGRINDEQTRLAAERLIKAEIRELVDDRLLKPNDGDTQNWFVDVYEDSQNVDEVNIDIGVTPQGIAKRIDETVTINT